MGRHFALTRIHKIAGAAVVVAATSCAICAGTTAPMAAASILPLSPSVQSLITSGIVTDDTRSGAATDYFTGLPRETVMVVTPGTDDTSLRPRIDSYVANRTTLVVDYPQSFGPIIAGPSANSALLAPSYDESKKIAIEGNLVVMEAFRDDPSVTFAVYTGYSQGADALGDAVEKAISEGTIDPRKSLIVLTSDPRGPWGFKQGLEKFPLVPSLASSIGADINGARNPADTENIEVMQIIVTADPVGNWQFDSLRPLSSLVVNVAGFFACHSAPECHGNLEQYGPPKVFKSVEGNTTYHVYKSEHPLTMAMKAIYRDLGIVYTQEDVDRWESKAQAFFPVAEPSVKNSAVPVYEVTMPVVNAVANPEPIVSAPEVSDEGATPDVEKSAPMTVPEVELPASESNDLSSDVTEVMSVTDSGEFSTESVDTPLPVASDSSAQDVLDTDMTSEDVSDSDSEASSDVSSAESSDAIVVDANPSVSVPDDSSSALASSPSLRTPLSE